MGWGGGVGWDVNVHVNVIFLHRITFELVGFVPSIVVDMSCAKAFV